MPTKIKRPSPKLLNHLAAAISEGHATSFRKLCRHESSDIIWKSITTMSRTSWDRVCHAQAKTAVHYALRRPGLVNSKRSRSQLAFQMARASMHNLRKILRLPQTSPAEHAILCRYVSAADLMGFGEYRNTFDVLAGQLIDEMTVSRQRCASCRHARNYKSVCEACGQNRCPIHCKCTTGGKRAAKWKR